LIESGGKTLWKAEPDDWRAVRNEKGIIRQPIRFQGQYHDEETGLYYNRFRFYDPLQGRYITQDPIGLRGGLNNFAYTRNPVEWVDPLGLDDVPSESGSACECTNMMVKRKHTHILNAVKEAITKKPSGEDYYGHWWMEIGNESYGWWPSGKVGLKETIWGVLGVLNGVGSFGGASTKDPHHDDSAEEEFHPKIKGGVSAGESCADKCAAAADCFKDFAKAYSEQWAWPAGIRGENCHSFQEQGMKKCKLTK
jgi:RHS repeat-associated protein